MYGAPAGAVADPAEAGNIRVHRIIMRFALGAGTIFAWVIVFRTLYFLNGTVGGALSGTAVLYGLSQLIVLVLTPLTGAALMHGYQRALMFGTIGAGFAFTCVALVFAYAPSVNGATTFSLLGSFAIFMGLHRALYFVPFSVAAEHARHLQGPLGHAGEVAVALAPLIGGVALDSSWIGETGVFASFAALIFVTLLPLFRMRDVAERFEWNYRETVDALISPLNRRGVVLSFYDGVQGISLLLAWPIAVYLIVGQSFATLGLVMALTLLATLVVRRLRKHWQMKRHGEPVLAMVAFSGWLLRFAAAFPIAVVIVDVYAHATHSPRKRGIDTFIGEQLADGGHFVDEYTALREMGMALGRLFGAWLIVVCALSFGVDIAFAILFIAAGISAAASVILSRRLAENRLPV